MGELGKRNLAYPKCANVTLVGNELEKFRLCEGDFLLARAIGSISHLGKASIFQKQNIEYVYDSHVMRLRFKKDFLSSNYFYQLLKTDGGRSIFLQNSAQTAVQFNINSKQISNMEIPVPPIDLQNEYIKKLDKLNSLNKLNQKHDKLIELNFNSLMQKIFNNELNIKAVA